MLREKALTCGKFRLKKTSRLSLRFRMGAVASQRGVSFLEKI